MQHILFARFGEVRRAASSVAAIRARAVPVLGVVMHEGARDEAEFEQVIQHSGELAETDLRHALVVGAVSGALAGILCGTVLALLGVFPGSVLHGIWFGALMGVLVGFLMMSIFGAGLMDSRLRGLARGLHSGDVVLTIRTADGIAAEQVRRILEENGAEVASKTAA